MLSSNRVSSMTNIGAISLAQFQRDSHGMPSRGFPILGMLGWRKPSELVLDNVCEQDFAAVSVDRQTASNLPSSALVTRSHPATYYWRHSSKTLQNSSTFRTFGAPNEYSRLCFQIVKVRTHKKRRKRIGRSRLKIVEETYAYHFKPLTLWSIDLLFKF